MKLHYQKTAAVAAALGALLFPGAQSLKAAAYVWNSNTDNATLQTNANWNPNDSNPTASGNHTYQIGGAGSGTGNPLWSSGTINANATVNQQGLTVKAVNPGGAFAINGIYNLIGGSLIHRENNATFTRRLFVQNNGTLNVNGGALGTETGDNLLRGYIDAQGANAKINLISGSILDGSHLRTTNNGTINLQGGNFSITTLTLGHETWKADTGYLNVTGGSTSVGTFNLGANRTDHNSKLTFGAGNGTLSITTFNFGGPANQSKIDFLTGTGGALTINGYTSSSYETWWNDNRLLWNGQSKSALGGIAFSATDFLVTGSTLTLVPEPSAFVMMLSGVGTLLLLRRRRF